MHLFQSSKIRHSISFGIGAAIGFLYVVSAITAHADVTAGVNVAANGQAMVRGARVIAVSGDTITAASQWGAARIIWTVQISGTTRFTPARENETLPADVQIGETIGFSGLLDQDAASPTVSASSVRNETVLQSASVLTGSVIGTDAEGLVIQTETGTSTIRVSTGTIMTKDGNRAVPGDVLPGETVKAFGTFNARLRVLDAERILSVSPELPKIPNTGARQKSTFFETIVAWINLHKGALSVR